VIGRRCRSTAAIHAGLTGKLELLGHDRKPPNALMAL
jgi:hypothetical protein